MNLKLKKPLFGAFFCDITKTMTIYLGADHRGFQLKEIIKKYLLEQGRNVEDLGALKFNKTDDYPIYAKAVAQKVRAAEQQGLPALGFLFCSFGSGMAMAANKFAGIRAVAIYDARLAKHAKMDNNANVITFGEIWISPEQVKKLINIFLQAEFDLSSRHQRRVNQVNGLAKAG